MGQSRHDGARRVGFGLVAAAVLAGTAGCAGGTKSGGQGNTGAATVGGPATQGTPTAMNPTSGLMGGVLGTAGAPSTMVGQGSPTTGVMPCSVDTVVKSSCQMCHGATPIAGAPMSLLSLADFQRDYTAKTTKQLLGQTMKMYELARIRINKEMGTTQMPQGMPLASDAFTTLNSWLSGGAPAGSACASTGSGTAGSGVMQKPPANTAGMGSTATAGTGGTVMQPPGTPMASTQCDDPKAFDPLVAKPGETCWEFQTHGVSAPGDTSKFTIPVDESYNQFYFDIPWPADAVETRFGTIFDNQKVLHHWLAFSQASPTADGTVSPNVTGTTLFEGAELIAGWAIGGCSTTYPDDVGVHLPTGTLMIQWHHFNTTGTPQQDGSKVQICTVPSSARAHIAGLTFLGTESLTITPGMSDATSSCTNNSGGPITIVGFTPHMHTIGSNMKSVVERTGGGGTLEVFNKPFVFDQQINYMLTPQYVLQPGDTITTTCTYTNNTGGVVGFGQSTNQEMCYQFTLSYPYGALNNGVLSLIGATNTCW